MIKLSATVQEVSYFATSDWCALNSTDSDIGSIGPMLIQGGQIFQAGKPGDWYLINSATPGGIGGQINTAHIDSCPTSDAVFGGMAYMAPYVYIPCDSTGLVALQENTSVTPNTFSVAWKSSFSFSPSAPIVAGGVVWTMGSSTLYGFDAVTGTQRFSIPISGHTRFATPTEDNGGVITSDPDAASWATGHLDAFARGQDNAIWHRAWNGTTWGSWDSLGGVSLSDAGAVSGTANRIDVFIRGQDNGLWHRMWNGTAWQPWESLGGVLSAGPDAASWGATRLDVVIRGQDNALWHRSWNGTAWQPWEGLGGVLSSDPTAVSWGANQLDVFIRGQDRALWHRSWNGTAWQPWEGLGGVLNSSPDVSSCASGKLDVFAVGQDGALWRRSFSAGAWGGWTSLGGQWTSGPGAVCQPGTTKIDLFQRGTDSALWRVEIAS